MTAGLMSRSRKRKLRRKRNTLTSVKYEPTAPNSFNRNRNASKVGHCPKKRKEKSMRGGALKSTELGTECRGRGVAGGILQNLMALPPSIQGQRGDGRALVSSETMANNLRLWQSRVPPRIPYPFPMMFDFPGPFGKCLGEAEVERGRTGGVLLGPWMPHARAFSTETVPIRRGLSDHRRTSEAKPRGAGSR